MLDGRVLEASQVEYKPFGKPLLKREPDPNHIPDLDFRACVWPCAQCCAEQSQPFRGQSSEVRRHLRGSSVLPSVDLVQDVRQHEVPLAPPARSGSYATQHGLLDGADGALREVGVAPGHP